MKKSFFDTSPCSVIPGFDAEQTLFFFTAWYFITGLLPSHICASGCVCLIEPAHASIAKFRWICHPRATKERVAFIRFHLSLRSLKNHPRTAGDRLWSQRLGNAPADTHLPSNKQCVWWPGAVERWPPQTWDWAAGAAGSELGFNVFTDEYEWDQTDERRRQSSTDGSLFCTSHQPSIQFLPLRH